MIKPLLFAGLAVSILGNATAAHAHGDSRGDHYSCGRSGCESRSYYSNSRGGGRWQSYGHRYGSSRYCGSRYGHSGRRGYEDHGRWDDRDDDRGHEHARADSRDYDRDEDRDWQDRADDRDDDRFDRESAPHQPSYELAPRRSGTPGTTRRGPSAGTVRRPAL